MKMNILKEIDTMKQNAITFQDDIRNYNCIAQRIFSALIIMFFCLHILIIHLIDCETFEFNKFGYTIYTAQLIFSLCAYFLFKYYFPKNKKYISIAAYINIFQTMIVLEIQRYLNNEYLSYTIFLCIIICTTMVLIGHIRVFMCLIASILLIDMVFTMSRSSVFGELYYKQRYVLENLFVYIIIISVNYLITRFIYMVFDKNKKILYLSERDGLTDLLNRRALEYCINCQAKNDSLCAMILLDLDNFKKINDTLGHMEGDNCLCKIADNLKSMFRHTDYVARLGGDEFVIFMNDIKDRDSAIDRAKMILEKIPHSYYYKGKEFVVTCSIGMAFTNVNNADLYRRLYLAADKAMYKSKEEGKNKLNVVDDLIDIN